MRPRTCTPASSHAAASENSKYEPVSLRLAGGSQALKARRGGHRAETAPEIQTDVRLGLLPPAEGASPAVRIEQQGEGEHRPGNSRDGARKAPRGAILIVHTAMIPQSPGICSGGGALLLALRAWVGGWRYGSRPENAGD